MEKRDKYLDNIAGKVFKNSIIESPSMDFTKNIMSEIEGIKSKALFTYSPVISRKVWIYILVIAIIIIFSILFFDFNTENLSWMNKFSEKLSLNNLAFKKFSFVSVSNATVYASLIASAMFILQIYLLKKNYLESQINQ